MRRKDTERRGDRKSSADSREHKGRLWPPLGPATRALTPVLTTTSGNAEGTGGPDQDAVTARWV